MRRVVIVGCGSIGARHARNAASLQIGELLLVDTDRDRREAVARETGGRAARDLSDALERGCDAAIICTPPAGHLAAASRCITAGCRLLLIEKPISSSLDELDRLADDVAAHRVRAAVAYQLRFHPAIARLRELATSGAIGRLLSIRAEFGQYLPDWRPSRDYRRTYTAIAAEGGGMLLDGSHEIDYVRWIAGEIESVYASAGKLSDLDMDAEDFAAVILKHSAGAVGEIHVDCLQHGYSRTCTLIGTEATVRWSIASGLEITSRGGIVRKEALVADPNAAYVSEMQELFENDGRPSSLASLSDGARVLAIALAARRSAAERKEISL